MSLPIDKVKSILDLPLALGNAAGKSLEDGKVSLTDISNLVAVVPTVIPSIQAMISLGEVIEQLKDLDDAEKAELGAYIVEKFDIPQDKVEEYIELGLKAAIEIAQVVVLFAKKDAA